jgi:hypothetical protein
MSSETIATATRAVRKRPNSKTADAIYKTESGGWLLVPSRAMLLMRDASRKDYGPDWGRMGRVIRAARVSPTVVYVWLKKYRECPWFKEWLLGGPLPENARVVTVHQAAGCRAGLDYLAHCSNCEPRLSPDHTYMRWIGRQIADLGWLRWLYGFREPKNTFVVDGKLQALRRERTQQAICIAAEIAQCTPIEWRKDGQKKAALELITAAIAKSGKAPAELPHDVDGRTIAKMVDYAMAARLAACCERAGLTVSEFLHARQTAKAAGAICDLDRFLNSEGDFGKGKGRLSGLVTPTLFVPTPAMLAFRKVASKAMGQHGVFVLNDVPGFEQWFVDWTMPKKTYGRRRGLADSSRAAANALADGTAEPSPSATRASTATPQRRGRRGRPPGKTEKVASRVQALLEAWDLQRFGPVKARYGREFGICRQDATTIINGHEKCKKVIPVPKPSN